MKIRRRVIEIPDYKPTLEDAVAFMTRQICPPAPPLECVHSDKSFAEKIREVAALIYRKSMGAQSGYLELTDTYWSENDQDYCKRPGSTPRS